MHHSLSFTLGSISIKSPYYQYLSNCSSGSYKTVRKKTSTKGIVCPMIKDEVGFLSEWTAFYEMQGFDHIIFFDNNSTTSFDELSPWIKDGFVTIRRNWWLSDSVPAFIPRHNNKDKFNFMMRVKMMAEVECKAFASSHGYEIFVSLDMDEYLMPSSNDNTVMDELETWFNKTTRGVMMIPKFQFPPTPHILEPVNLLTIEAYQTRMRGESRMNYYTSVSNKVALRLLNGLEYTRGTIEFLTYCCDFHGCGNYNFHKNCVALFKAGEKWKIEGKHKRWMETLHIHHYARSLEKYILKQNTWDTAGSNRGYDIYNFLDRTLGFEFDDSAISWGCQLRDVLRNRTGEPHYVRPGDMWYRNVEFGKTVSDPHKRGRFGAGYGKKIGQTDMNPYPPGETYQKAHKVYGE
eukprot:gene30880-40191_t